MLDKLLLYDTFNARYFSFREVAQSFVVNDEFVSLTKDNSLLLMGSRGCGKTTLLKMLTPAGLNYWQDENSKSIRDKIGFTGIYIPSDIQWKNQFEYLNKHLNDRSEVVEVLVQFLFSSNVQIALCKTFKSYLDFNCEDEGERIELEFKIVKAISEVWTIDSVIPTFDSVEIKILDRIRELNRLVRKSIFKRNLDIFTTSLPDYVYDEFFDITKVACKVFEEKLNLNDSHKWALCFDELEIVPKFIQLKLVTFLRSVDQKFIFKLTTTPLFNIEDRVLDVTQGNDFSSIKLWVYDDNGLQRWVKFSEQLLTKKFKQEYDFKEEDVNKIFGVWTIDQLIKQELSDLTESRKASLGYKNKFYPSTAKESSLYFLFKQLASIDNSFKEFLKSRGVNPKEPYTDNKIIRKSVFLKYKRDALYRLIYKGRSRRTPPIHYGTPHIFDLCDGNPRLIIGLVNEILQNSDVHSEGLKQIPSKTQSNITFKASEKYYNLLENHPDSTITISNRDFNLASDLLDRIGKYFYNNLVEGDFNKNAPTTFIVDEDINAKIVGLLETALYLGAIVYLDPVESLSSKGILNKRFRLSGFLTPKYKIPNRINSRVKLSTILNKTSEGNKQRKFFE
tara:strand:+ start:29963 stop:31819 length:1857 start_codon:yes stop_codon:yes gene_type:complete